MSAAKLKRVTMRALAESLMEERDQAIDNAAMWKKSHKRLRAIHRQNLQVLWQQATGSTHDYGHVDAVVMAVAQLSSAVAGFKSIFDRLPEDTRREYLRTLDTLRQEEEARDGTP